MQRLWCIFELSAFLHAHPLDDQSRNLVICPILAGPALISCHIGWVEGLGCRFFRAEAVCSGVEIHASLSCSSACSWCDPKNSLSRFPVSPAAPLF